MIDRYIISAEKNVIKSRYNLADDFDQTVTYNATPTDKLPIILNNQSNSIVKTYWGQTPDWSHNKKLSVKLFNAPINEARTKKSLAIGLENRRCIIPATGFVVWNKLGKKTSIPYLYHLPVFELFSIAGVWEEYSDIDGIGYLTFKILTQPSENLKIISPLILSQEDEMSWLSGNQDTGSFPESMTNEFKFYSISPVMHKTQPDDPEMIKHIPPVDQQGNYTLFS